MTVVVLLWLTELEAEGRAGRTQGKEMVKHGSEKLDVLGQVLLAKEPTEFFLLVLTAAGTELRIVLAVELEGEQRDPVRAALLLVMLWNVRVWDDREAELDGNDVDLATASRRALPVREEKARTRGDTEATSEGELNSGYELQVSTSPEEVLGSVR